MSCSTTSLPAICYLGTDSANAYKMAPINGEIVNINNGKNNDDIELPSLVNFSLLDVVWSRASEGCSIWPAVITSDPVTGLHTRVTEGGQRQYYVYFLGSKQNDWAMGEYVSVFEKENKNHHFRSPIWKSGYNEACILKHLPLAERQEMLFKNGILEHVNNKDSTLSSVSLRPARLSVSEKIKKLMATAADRHILGSSTMIREVFTAFNLFCRLNQPANGGLKSYISSANLAYYIGLWKLCHHDELISYEKQAKLIKSSAIKMDDEPDENEINLIATDDESVCDIACFACKIPLTGTDHLWTKCDVLKCVEFVHFECQKTTSPFSKLWKCENCSRTGADDCKTNRSAKKMTYKRQSVTESLLNGSLLGNADEIASKEVTHSNEEAKKKKTRISTTVVNSDNRSNKTTLSEFNVKKDAYCPICEEISFEPNKVRFCHGHCQNTYHLNCLSSDADCQDANDANTASWKCNDCRLGLFRCFLCKTCDKVDGKVAVKCSTPLCFKYYHVKCLKDNCLWPQTEWIEYSFVCPAHLCHTCASDNLDTRVMKYNTRLVRCIRCPATYHFGDQCTAAGSLQVNSSYIICPKHCNRTKRDCHINTSWCFFCSKGGSLICCELCPASFHAECLALDEPIVGKYYCDQCKSGRMPLYGEVVWVKMGAYRWWPSRIIHPSNIPDNVERMPHQMGQLPIQFCGSNDYCWINYGRCFQYETGDSEKIVNDTSQSRIIVENYRKGLLEAAELHEQYIRNKEKREAANVKKFKQVIKSAIYVKIKNNQPYGDVQIFTGNPALVQICDCDPTKPNPCGPDTECLNRMLLVECSPSSCPAGSLCGNRLFQKHIYPKLKSFHTKNRGWGLKVVEPVKKGHFIIEYVGELVSMNEFRRRLNERHNRKDEQDYYFMTMDVHRMIDAGPKGNLSRFINHSCDPNCRTAKWTVNGDTRVGIFALTDISPGTEITFNYQFEAAGGLKKKCLCNSSNCSGYIGLKPKSDSASDNKLTKILVKKKRSRKSTSLLKVWEDSCYRCLGVGELMMCDFRDCPKVYHLHCLGRDSKPHGKWFCPWHHCVACGKSAIAFCNFCPNAYCKSHSEGKLTMDKALKNPICNEHLDDYDDIIAFYDKTVNGVENKPHSEKLNDKQIVNDNNCLSSSPNDLNVVTRKQDDVNCRCVHFFCSWTGSLSDFPTHHKLSHKEYLQLTFAESEPNQVVGTQNQPQLWNGEKYAYTDSYQNKQKRKNQHSHSAEQISPSPDFAAAPLKRKRLNISHDSTTSKKVKLTRNQNKSVVLDKATPLTEPVQSTPVDTSVLNVKSVPVFELTSSTKTTSKRRGSFRRQSSEKSSSSSSVIQAPDDSNKQNGFRSRRSNCDKKETPLLNKRKKNELKTFCNFDIGNLLVGEEDSSNDDKDTDGELDFVDFKLESNVSYKIL